MTHDDENVHENQNDPVLDELHNLHNLHDPSVWVGTGIWRADHVESDDEGASEFDSHFERLAVSAPSRRSRRKPVAVALAFVVLAAVTGAGLDSAWNDLHASTPKAPSSTGFHFRFADPGFQLPSGQGFSFGQAPSSSAASAGNGITTASGSPSDVSAIAAKVDPALVDINSTFSYQGESGAGTGIVLTSTGLVITNNHVINGATSISVTDIGNGRTYTATVVGYDASADIAVLQLSNASGLTTAKIGNSSRTALGEPIVAIGNAGGTGGTPSSAGGSITALDQSISASDSLDNTSESLSGLIGVNADVQPGDSGGSLVSSAGKVIGIDVAGSASSSSFAYTGGTPTGTAGTDAYAIPINEAMSIARQIESGKGTSTIHVGRPGFLGVMVSTNSSSEVMVVGVVGGGAAAQAGLKAGDVITAIDGHSVSTPTELARLLLPLHPGDAVSIGWTSVTGQSAVTTAVLGSGPPA
jgi:S1-C subfamily serine protease